MKLSLLDSGDGGKYHGFDFVEMSKLFATQDAFFVGTTLFGRILLHNWCELHHARFEYLEK